MDTQGINSIERIQILGVNVDVCKPEELPEPAGFMETHKKETQ